MTLKNYTDFVVKFALVAYGITPALATEREKEQFRALIEELVSLLGLENWEKLTDIFMERVNFPKGFDKHAHILENILWERSKFTETLAEFCEPLLVKSEGKEKGGQDAAKV